jgi:hypothetical protein
MVKRHARLAIVCVTTWLVPVGARAQADHGWVSGNLVAIVATTNSFQQNLAYPFRFEMFTGSVVYDMATRPSFDIGGGVALTPRAGLGVAVSRRSTSGQAAVAISVPDVLRYNLFGTATTVTTDSLPHTETAVHLEAAYFINVTRGRIRLFVGPSITRVHQEVVTDVQYTESTNGTSHTIGLIGVSHGQAADTAWGFNVGADGSLYISRHFGVGAMMRYSRGTATITNVLQTAGTGHEVTQDLTVGGLSLGGGLRVRF